MSQLLARYNLYNTDPGVREKSRAHTNTHKHTLILKLKHSLRDHSCSSLSAGCITAVLERKAVLLWVQLWDQTPHTWQNWIWAVINQETQEWSCSLLYWRIHTVNWRNYCKLLIQWCNLLSCIKADLSVFYLSLYCTVFDSGNSTSSKQVNQNNTSWTRLSPGQMLILTQQFHMWRVFQPTFFFSLMGTFFFNN